VGRVHSVSIGHAVRWFAAGALTGPHMPSCHAAHCPLCHQFRSDHFGNDVPRQGLGSTDHRARPGPFLRHLHVSRMGAGHRRTDSPRPRPLFHFSDDVTAAASPTPPSRVSPGVFSICPSRLAAGTSSASSVHFRYIPTPHPCSDAAGTSWLAAQEEPSGPKPDRRFIIIITNSSCDSSTT
jgi:hypothetical protein